MKNFFIFIIFAAAFLYSCQSRRNNQFNFDSIYTAKRQADSFVVTFQRKTDTVFIWYYFTFKDGGYLNYPLDSLDYAGVFLADSIKDRQITFPVKDYREYWNDSSKVYNVSLSFLSDTTFLWYIDSIKYGILDFLPHNMVFKKKM